MIKPFDARIGKRLPKKIVSDLRFFGYYIGNESLLLPDKLDMSIVHEPSNAIGELYMLKLFGTYNTNFSYNQKNSEISFKTYLQSLHSKSSVELPLNKDEVKYGLDWRHAIVRFMLDLGNRNLNTIPLVDHKEDYCLGVINNGNSMEMITAIFCNTLRMGKNYNIINENWVRHRTSQYLRLLNDDAYVESPTFKKWEMMLWV